MRRSGWGAEDAVLCMAVHLDRPPRLHAPPTPERVRLASILRRDEAEVGRHIGCMVALDAGRDDACGACAGAWAQYRDDAVGLWEAADRFMAKRRGVPHHLRARRGRSG